MPSRVAGRVSPSFGCSDLCLRNHMLISFFPEPALPGHAVVKGIPPQIGSEELLAGGGSLLEVVVAVGKGRARPVAAGFSILHQVLFRSRRMVVTQAADRVALCREYSRQYGNDRQPSGGARCQSHCLRIHKVIVSAFIIQNPVVSRNCGIEANTTITPVCEANDMPTTTLRAGVLFPFPDSFGGSGREALLSRFSVGIRPGRQEGL